MRTSLPFRRHHKHLAPSRGWRGRARVVASVAALATILGTTVVSPPSYAADSTLGSFEIDGNLADDSPVVDGSNEPLDWESLDPATTPITAITDLANPDDLFGQGSKQLNPAGWVCVTGKAPSKVDIVSGQVAVRKVGLEQFLYASFFRKDVNGDAHMDFEFNKSNASVNASCPGVPARTQNDVLVAFDTENGGAKIKVRIFLWNGNATSGSFAEVSTADYAAGAVNIPPSQTIPEHQNGDFGEAVINLSKTIGDLSCADARGVWLKTRSSTSISSELKDYTRATPVLRGDCPNGTPTKQVRNLTTDPQGEFADTATAAPGDTLEYQLTYTNDGGGTATDVRFTDTIAPKQTFASCSDDCDGTTNLAWGPFSVDAGTSKSVTFQVTLTGPFDAGSTAVKNSAVMRSAEEGPKTSNETTTTVTATADSAVGKLVRNLTTDPQGDFADSVDARPGDQVEYQLTYTNTGNAAATNVVVTDPVPNKTTFVSCDPNTCTRPDNVVTWSLGTQAPGATVELTFIVQLDATGWAQGQAVPVKNTALVCATGEGCDPSDEVTVTVKTPSLALVKAVRNVTAEEQFTADGPTSTTAAPGNELQYRLTVTNPGVAPATGVVVADTIQARQTFLECNGCTKTGSTLSWPSTTVDPGETVVYTFNVRLDATFPAGDTPVKNTGVVDSNEEEPKTSNETTTTVPAAPIPGLAKAVRNVTAGQAGFSGSTDASPGDTVEYQLTYSNSGNADAVGVVLTDPVPGGTSYVSCTGGCSQQGGTVTWNLGTVAPGETPTVTFTVTVNGTGFTPGTTTPVQNVARACIGDDCTDSPEVTVNVKTPSSSLDKSVRNVTDGQVTFTPTTTGDPGEVIEYKLVYTNNGPGIAHDVVVTDPVPYRTTYLSCSGDCTAEGGAVSWYIAEVPANITVAMTFQVRLDAVFPSGTTEVVNVGEVETREEPDGTSSDPVTVTVTAAPKLALVKSTATTGTVVLNQLVTYTLAYSNSGNAVAEDTVVTETVPTGTTFVSCDPGCTRSGSTVTWSVGAVAPGGGGSVTITVQAARDVACTVCNVATVASPSQGNGAPVSSNQVCLVAQPAPDPFGAHASGSALGAALTVSVPVLGTVIDDERLSEAESSHAGQTGLGVTGDEAYLDTAPIPNPLAIPGVLSAAVMRTRSTSTVSDDPGPTEARQLSTAETLDLELLDGLVTADVVLASAEAQADGGSSSYSSAGSTFKNLVVNGVARNDVAPNTTIAIGDVTGLGLGVKVVLREEVASTGSPGPTQTSGGTYASNLKVNMIHVTVSDADPVTPGAQPIDIIVSQAIAHADFPQTRLCDTTRPLQAVSGHAEILHASVALPLADASAGYVVIPASGGTQQVHLDGLATVFDDAAAPIVTAETADAYSTGAVSDGLSAANSYASVEDLCIKLDGPDGPCAISATAVRSVASSTADADGVSSAPGFGTDLTRFVDLRIGALPAPLNEITLTPDPNTVIEVPGIGVIILNEQTCDNGGTIADLCRDGTLAGHTGITVRAIHVIITAGPGAEVIVAEAHSDARYS